MCGFTIPTRTLWFSRFRVWLHATRWQSERLAFQLAHARFSLTALGTAALPTLVDLSAPALRTFPRRSEYGRHRSASSVGALHWGQGPVATWIKYI